MSCKNGCDKCQCGNTKGERGLQGVKGLQGETGPAGPAGGGIVNRVSFYNELVSQVEVGDTGANYHFPPGYEILSWTNTTGSPIILHVMANYNTRLEYNNTNELKNEVDGAIIQTILGVDTVLWESLGTKFLTHSLYGGPTASDFVNTSTAETVQTVPTSNLVDVRFGSAKLDDNISIMKKLTLQNNETISLKFKTKALGDRSTLLKAQFFLQQLDM